MKNIGAGVLLFLAIFLLLKPEVAEAWWNDGWNFRKQIRLDLSPSGANTDSTLSDVPVLLRLSAGNFAYFGDAKPDGSDLRFVAGDDVTPLAFYIEKFDSLNQIALVWVRLPRLTAGQADESIYMYYGNPESVSASDSAAVFDPQTQLVYDFSDSDGRYADRTGYGNQPQIQGVTHTETALIGGGAVFAGADSSITLPNAPGLRLSPSTGSSLSFWLRPSTVAADGEARILTVGLEDSDADSLALGLRNGALELQLPDESLELVSAVPLTANGWTHVALTTSGDATVLYVDGQESARGAALSAELVGEWRIGGGSSGFSGDIDQFAFHAATLPPAEVRIAAMNEAPFSNVAAYGEDAQREGSETGGESYFAITLRNVTVDGWVVIVICMIMAVISWVVMYLKGMLLSRVERQNRQFLSEYSKLTGDPLALDAQVSAESLMKEEPLLASALEDNASFQPSTLFPLYQIGALEVKKRLGERSPAVGAQAAGFSAETIGAIGSSIDAALVRQRQKLNRLMVLLTIAISGGPFLGLLGTVVGVMITFAAIAASGDVNVNSIAPGIAAALVATVAGLVVAIPALFGYNWLGSRIKDIDANTQVFADEFINKIAEHYC